MENLQNRLGNGINSIQNNFEKGKEKVEVVKEKSRLSKIIEDAQDKKVQLLAEIGLVMYQKIREGSIVEHELDDIYESIKGFDYIIYDSKKKITNLENMQIQNKCSCGSEIEGTNKFCRGCGKKVEVYIEKLDLCKCNNCESDIEYGSKFCPCCGRIVSI